MPEPITQLDPNNYNQKVSRIKDNFNLGMGRADGNRADANQVKDQQFAQIIQELLDECNRRTELYNSVIKQLPKEKKEK